MDGHRMTIAQFRIRKFDSFLGIDFEAINSAMKKSILILEATYSAFIPTYSFVCLSTISINIYYYIKLSK